MIFNLMGSVGFTINSNMNSRLVAMSNNTTFLDTSSLIQIRYDFQISLPELYFYLLLLLPTQLLTNYRTFFVAQQQTIVRPLLYLYCYKLNYSHSIYIQIACYFAIKLYFYSNFVNILYIYN